MTKAKTKNHSPKPSVKKNKPRSLKSRSQSKTKISLPRPPVVTILGHVDHGKTTLLDTIRKTKLQAQETGGITQHIGAYQVAHQGQKITFIDTPGHAAFAKMRQRGAQVTDLVILVIAANDGVKPQTKESIQHIKAANVPMIVAINKMDMPGASPDKVKAQLAENKVIVEDYGGDIVCTEIIARSGKGVPQLLEMILLVCQLQELKNEPQGKLKAVIIESKLEKQKGIVVSAILNSGTLKTGDNVQVGSNTTKVRALFGETGELIKQVTPGYPVEILGFKVQPQVGEIIFKEGESPEINKPQPKKVEKAAKPKAEETETEESEEEEEKPRIKAIIKADTQGTLEAIKVNVAEEVEQVGEGVGEVSESDVLLAQATGATILAFRVKTSKQALKLAEVEKVTIKTYQAIYELLEDLEKQVLKLLEPTIDEEIVGEAEIIAEFSIKKHKIAGCKVKTGQIDIGGDIHLIRNSEIIKSAKIRSLKQGKKDVAVVKKGEECGIVLKPSLDFQIGDIIQYYRIIEPQ